MATTQNSTTPLPGYQRFTVEITDVEAAMLLAETAEQAAFSREWSEQRGFTYKPLSPDDMASILLGNLLRRMAAALQKKDSR